MAGSFRQSGEHMSKEAPKKMGPQHIEAMKSIVDSLEPMHPDTRRRIVKAVCIILDIQDPMTPAPAEAP
jgi:hypothetical protein